MEFMKHVLPIFLSPHGEYPSKPVFPVKLDFEDEEEALVVEVSVIACCFRSSLSAYEVAT